MKLETAQSVDEFLVALARYTVECPLVSAPKENVRRGGLEPPPGYPLALVVTDHLKRHKQQHVFHCDIIVLHTIKHVLPSKV